MQNKVLATSLLLISLISNMPALACEGPECRGSVGYEEAFKSQPLVIAVLNGNYYGVIKYLNAGHNPHVKLSFNRGLRHIADEEIDALLLKHDVAPIKKSSIIWGSAELLYTEDPDSKRFLSRYSNDRAKIDAIYARYLSGPDKFKERYPDLGGELTHTIERNPYDKDVYGKFPEDYSFEKRSQIAYSMREAHYKPLRLQIDE